MQTMTPINPLTQRIESILSFPGVKISPIEFGEIFPSTFEVLGEFISLMEKVFDLIHVLRSVAQNADSDFGKVPRI